MDLIKLKTKQDLKRIIVEELRYPAVGDQPFLLSAVRYPKRARFCDIGVPKDAENSNISHSQIPPL